VYAWLAEPYLVVSQCDTTRAYLQYHGTGTRYAVVCRNPIPYLYLHYLLWKTCRFSRTHVQPMTPQKLWYGMYPHPIWVWCSRVQVRFRKSVPTVYPWQTLTVKSYLPGFSLWSVCWLSSGPLTVGNSVGRLGWHGLWL
jgi:hypothetical protein